MIDLKALPGPCEIPLVPDLPDRPRTGIAVTVKPLDTPTIEAARAAARDRLAGLKRQLKDLREAGRDPGDLAKLDDPAEEEGTYTLLVTQEVACRTIISWTGVVFGGAPAPVTRETVCAAMRVYPLGERFYERIMWRHSQLVAAGNGSTPSAGGTTTPTEGAATAAAAGTPGCPAPTDGAAPADGSAPMSSTPPER